MESSPTLLERLQAERPVLSNSEKERVLRSAISWDNTPGELFFRKIPGRSAPRLLFYKGATKLTLAPGEVTIDDCFEYG